jgi:hypothetical protein
MAETSQVGMTAPVHPWQPLSLIQDGQTECPLLKTQVFALLQRIRKTNMSAIC